MSEPELTQDWYVLKHPDGHCEIQSIPKSEAESRLPDRATDVDRQWWGPFTSREDAIARRVGLIRAGKCQPQR
jgi:hypothetical protein